jgi:DNA-binding transcriptional MerR regulator/mannose-6-phosphate isomerase-like protein (cupin superfamily)
VTYRIAEIATSLGVTPGTLRLWEQHGLIAPGRSESGHRVYRAADVKRAHRIATLRSDRGLALSEIRQMLTVKKSGAVGSAGERVRRLRLARRLSIRQLAGAVGVSVSVISTFERTSRGVGVKVLRSIADFFSVTVTALSVGVEPSAPGPVRRNAGRRIAALGEGIETRALATGPKLMDCKEWVIGPGSHSDGAYSHAGEEFLYVLSGVLEITVDGLGTMRLEARDSLYFDSTREHSWRNPEGKDCTVVWINTPASF